ncbi:hypothetical protein [Cochleicola gelatinilyticus]|uniref:Uncharacterized protein n=1 Tax=Cochleicola gelatinilyticus TaxID=1763537 RepID=A0A167H1W2_9FLAO|nr:hypothetical protein [Cochleicola gelatinilyticus]OAB78125.1 hypothetical protein ULVI_11630 [Cochleicola gelatinilyticus]
MHKEVQQIFKVIAATILTAALLFPVLFQFSHIFENHEHKTCSEVSVHLHEKKVDCSIYDFHISLFTYTLNSYDKLHIQQYNKLVITALIASEKEVLNHHFYLRGPPLYT